jgi:hypothetical protein
MPLEFFLAVEFISSPLLWIGFYLEDILFKEFET